ncbi:unnamed protein product [Blepharisma stoltei]|uniref:Uncharacterized protein n=1 Tax=Blepharisma stoltei TaxID=1481888 RepID=A0AAU9IH32_9CILI|nr:unnamed protein product [Blepharisma stoltei]
MSWNPGREIMEEKAKTERSDEDEGKNGSDKEHLGRLPKKIACTREICCIGRTDPGDVQSRKNGNQHKGISKYENTRRFARTNDWIRRSALEEADEKFPS